MPNYQKKPRQNPYDIAIQLYGSIEGLFDLFISNPDLSLASDWPTDRQLLYHDSFVLNETIQTGLSDQSVIPANNEGAVYFKHTDKPLWMMVCIPSDNHRVSFEAAGAGEVTIDWGDNSPLQSVTLTETVQTITHDMDCDVFVRKIKFFGNTIADVDSPDPPALTFTWLDTTGLGGSLTLCRPVIVDEYKCTGAKVDLTGLALFQDTFSVDFSGLEIDSLVPIGDMSLQELDLRGATVSRNAIDDYLAYVVSHYEDRRPCIVYLPCEPSATGYAAMDTILGEPEWNVSSDWQFYINDTLYTPTNGENTE